MGRKLTVYDELPIPHVEVERTIVLLEVASPLKLRLDYLEELMQ